MKLDYFFVKNINSLIQDSFESSHPISVAINDPNEIVSLFDDISYGKVIRTYKETKLFFAIITMFSNNVLIFYSRELVYLE